MRAYKVPNQSVVCLTSPKSYARLVGTFFFLNSNYSPTPEDCSDSGNSAWYGVQSIPSFSV